MSRRRSTMRWGSATWRRRTGRAGVSTYCRKALRSWACFEILPGGTAMRRTGCNRGDHPRLGCRELLQVGGMSLIGVGLDDLLRLEARASVPARRKPAKAVVFIFQSGGPSQHETFDPKPDAPDGIRGEYATTPTRVPGVRFCEHLPRLAARADRFAVVRTMHHPAGREFRNEHSSCMYLLHTG